MTRQQAYREDGKGCGEFCQSMQQGLHASVLLAEQRTEEEVGRLCLTRHEDGCLHSDNCALSLEEACKAEYSWMQFNEAMRQLEKEGVIKYNDLLEGYYLINP